MDTTSFALFVDRLVDDGRMDTDRAEDLLEQRQLFEEGGWKSLVEPPDHDVSICVGLIQGQVYTASTIHELMELTAPQRDQSAMYFELVTRSAWAQSYAI